MFVASLILTLAASSAPADMALVGPGQVRAGVEKDAAVVDVAAYFLDVDAVSNAAFLRFVQNNPQWRKGRTPALFAEESYLQAWRTPTQLGAQVLPDAPVTYVSWFAARAFCEAQGKRLPTTAEWELAARASATEKDASKDPRFTAQILDWYAHATPATLPSVTTAPKNAWGVRGLHGFIWEWVDDFAAAMVSSDARSQNDGDLARFCGGGAANAANAEDYASFMRWAFRGSLEARFATRALGFRCAKDKS